MKLTSPTALILEDDSSSLEAVAEAASLRGFATSKAASIQEAREQMRHGRFDLLVLDLVLPDGRATDLFDDFELDDSEVIIVTGQPTLDSSIQALRHEALDYLIKPVDFPRLRQHFDRVKESRSAHRISGDRCSITKPRYRATRRQPSHRRVAAPGDVSQFGPIVGSSPAMLDLYHRIARVSPTDAAVLIVGESGSGKELVAETVHRRSEARRGRLVALNCGAIPEGVIESELFGHRRGAFTGAHANRVGAFEQAKGGTLFLDEITEMPATLQVKLLRVLESKRVQRLGDQREIDLSDVRVIAATNRDPREAVNDGGLREDLFFRLSVFPIDVPALREREGDVPILAGHFLDRLNQEAGTRKTLAPDTVERLGSYRWPGNVRELRNAVHYAFILAGDLLEVEHLPASITGVPHQLDAVVQPMVGTPIRELEKRLILATLDRFDGRKPEAAQALGISLKTLYNRLNTYEVRGNA